MVEMSRPEGTRRAFARALEAARAGAADGFVDLWRSLDPILVRYLQIVAPDVAADVASATWVQVARGLECFPAEEPAFRSLLVRIARDETATLRAAGRRRPDSVIEQVQVDAARAAAHEAVRLVARLPAEMAELLALRLVVGLSTSDVADIVGVRAGAVRVAVQRALRRTADALTGAPAGASGLLDPWALDRILDEGELGVSRLDPALRALVSSLTTFGSDGDVSWARSDVTAARRAFARNAHRTKGFAPIALLCLLARRVGRSGSLLGSKGAAVALGTLVLSAPAAVAYSLPPSPPAAVGEPVAATSAAATGPSAGPFGAALIRPKVAVPVARPPSTPPSIPTVTPPAHRAARRPVTRPQPATRAAAPANPRLPHPTAHAEQQRVSARAAAPRAGHRHRPRRHRRLVVEVRW